MNSTCVLWQYVCGSRTACWLYDIVQLRYAYFGVNIGIKVLALIFAAGIYYSIKRQPLGENSEVGKSQNAWNMQQCLKTEVVGGGPVGP